MAAMMQMSHCVDVNRILPEFMAGMYDVSKDGGQADCPYTDEFGRLTGGLSAGSFSVKGSVMKAPLFLLMLFVLTVARNR